LELREGRQGRQVNAGRAQQNGRPPIGSSRLLQQNLPKRDVARLLEMEESGGQ